MQSVRETAAGKGPRISEGLYWAVHLAVTFQGRSEVILPDVLLRQVVWGADAAPKNWRKTILRLLRDQDRLTGQWIEGVEVVEDQDRAFQCPRQCALHGSGQPHRHLRVLIRYVCYDDPAAVVVSDHEKAFLGCLEVCGTDKTDDVRLYTWNPPPPDPDAPPPKNETEGWDSNHERVRYNYVKGLRKAGYMVAVYLPMLLFGTSPRMGLSRPQVQLHKAITRELTRWRGKRRPERPDNAEIISVSRNGPETGQPADYPRELLQAGTRYVGFNGNSGKRPKNLHGCGYRLGTWMGRAGYLAGTGSKGGTAAGEAAERLPDDFWEAARVFLRDLARLGKVFGLVAAGWHPKRHEWLDLKGMQAQLDSDAGRTWLQGCRLRVYTREDYLSRWRQTIAMRMGLSQIPDGRVEKHEQGGPAQSREALELYLHQTGLSRSELAEELGVSRSLVSQHMAGKRAWTPAWQARVQAWLADRAGDNRGKELTPGHQ